MYGIPNPGKQSPRDGSPRALPGSADTARLRKPEVCGPSAPSSIFSASLCALCGFVVNHRLEARPRTAATRGRRAPREAQGAAPRDRADRPSPGHPDPCLLFHCTIYNLYFIHVIGQLELCTEYRTPGRRAPGTGVPGVPGLWPPVRPGTADAIGGFTRVGSGRRPCRGCRYDVAAPVLRGAMYPSRAAATGSGPCLSISTFTPPATSA